MNKNILDGKPSWPARIFSDQDLIFNEVGESLMQANAIKCFKIEHQIPESPTHRVELDTGSTVAHCGPCPLGPRSSSMIRLFKGTWAKSKSRETLSLDSSTIH